MAYKAIEKFSERFHKGTVYKKGDPYPKKGFKAAPERVKALLSDANSYGYPFLEEIKKKEPETKKETKKEVSKK